MNSASQCPFEDHSELMLPISSTDLSALGIAFQSTSPCHVDHQSLTEDQCPPT